MFLSADDILQIKKCSRNQLFMLKQVLHDEFDWPICLDIQPCFEDKKLLPISHTSISEIDCQYAQLFEVLSQQVCKFIAKEWIKFICPKKQATFPYKSDRKPGWWPKHVPHVEPDHLTKSARIDILISILRYKDLDLLGLASTVQTLNGLGKNLELKKQVIQRLLYEIFYIGLYERFYFKVGNYQHLQRYLSVYERSVIENPFKIPVSDVEWAKSINQNKSELNDEIFTVNEEFSLDSTDETYSSDSCVDSASVISDEEFDSDVDELVKSAGKDHLKLEIKREQLFINGRTLTGKRKRGSEKSHRKIRKLSPDISELYLSGFHSLSDDEIQSSIGSLDITDDTSIRIEPIESSIVVDLFDLDSGNFSIHEKYGCGSEYNSGSISSLEEIDVYDSPPSSIIELNSKDFELNN